ncbi:HAD family acid phosphatase [Legionella waltersii]|uniref:Acid phosphatase n=1 Tax=Legionella waltersii TaxID=66969 RepID=A0A0W1ACZ3_9GAMM|nr:HAD family acid phosphatase [Legionella waltersii]KTD79210.1 acid phosphatase [Legionella waltersii]SNV12531.1 acid phosphatase, class B [Legionella waltersii]
MKRRYCLFTKLIIALCLCLSTPGYSEPQNISLVKKEIKEYHDSGRYQQELNQVIHSAKQYILEQSALHRAKNPNEKLAIVLDIDETSLSNYDKLVKHDFVGNKKEIHQEILAANSPGIKPMLELYNIAVKKGIKVFFVTGRKESERSATRINLLKAGYKNWSGLYLKPDNYSKPSIIPFKSKTRQLIAQKGYTILASIGDQYSDLKGGFAKKGFKLPNPYYYLP